MLSFSLRAAAGGAVVSLSLVAGPVQAQWFRNNCDCGPSSMVSASATTCQTVMQPVVQSCYQAVPVTEYHPVKQMVRRPKVETRMVNQDVIEYVPITEQRTAEVPTTTYQDVTEHQQVCRNVGYWQTSVQQNCRPSPCEYDNRTGMVGWMNRTSYEFRSMFTPRQTVRRQFVPQTVMQTVPVTRRVAVQGTRQVTYNVTKMVAQRSTRQVAMRHMSYEDVETTVQVPRTVMRHVPIGTSTAWAPLGPGSSSLSLQPIPDSSASAGRALENRSATNRSKDAFDATGNPNEFNKNENVPIKPKGASYHRVVPRDPGYQPDGQITKSPQEDAAPAKQHVVARRSSPPSMVRMNQWVARTPKQPEGPTSDMSLADVDRR